MGKILKKNRYMHIYITELLCDTPGNNPTFKINYTPKAMATHSSTLAWKIPWMEESARLQSMGSRRVGHD